MSTPHHIRLGSRGSALALWQTEHVTALLHAAYPGLSVEAVVFSTRGDQVLDKPLPLIGGKGLFTHELEEALRDGRIDGAVHSLKDLPTENPDGLALGAIPPRGDVADVLVIRDSRKPATLANGAVVGTGSRRRASQLLARRPDLRIQDIRGNVDTRIRKTLDPHGPYHATVLAAAGVQRLRLDEFISAVLPQDWMLPAPGQGALAVQCRQEAGWLEFFGGIGDPQTAAAVTAERAFLAGLGGGCSVPVAALATVHGTELRIQGRVTALDGSHQIDVQQSGTPFSAQQVGHALAQVARKQGAQDILDSIAPLEES